MWDGPPGKDCLFSLPLKAPAATSSQRQHPPCTLAQAKSEQRLNNTRPRCKPPDKVTQMQSMPATSQRRPLHPRREQQPTSHSTNSLLAAEDMPCGLSLCATSREGHPSKILARHSLNVSSSTSSPNAAFTPAWKTTNLPRVDATRYALPR